MYEHVFMHVCLYEYMHTREYVYKGTSVYEHKYVCMYVCMHVYAYIYACMYVRMYACMCQWAPLSISNGGFYLLEVSSSQQKFMLPLQITGTF